ncbi:hypothetical protein P7D58_02485 [Enterococcus avium]|uniref:hypothetical protein n=1 Tax=Enterococcus avium TaxID=33945 RepID=UPI00288EF7B8|nr:hypothetical protein [Enterococcus avium]MDT2392771.1 hypothetical protein [Enterococcus avium]MDT2416593.1 hypothetical protein [Enterococcus avium]MDT2429873.1 hypothetical protein [Enterococcus avium]MDT2438911.1 hypothetical protein [Enterococcus avium]MDT2451979.1 hypothetical protein [Enterococcus avium]
MNPNHEEIAREINSKKKITRFNFTPQKMPSTGYALQRKLYTEGKQTNTLRFGKPKGVLISYPETKINSLKERALINYDMNIDFFSNLDSQEYTSEILRFVGKNDFYEIDNLNDINKVKGCYLMCLDDYCQCYIGIANNMRTRIMQHWSLAWPLDRLVFGSDKSLISINSFGIFDTKRIFIKKYNINQKHSDDEDRFINSINEKFVLNRTMGGYQGSLAIAMENSRFREFLN